MTVSSSLLHSSLTCLHIITASHTSMSTSIWYRIISTESLLELQCYIILTYCKFFLSCTFANTKGFSFFNFSACTSSSWALLHKFKIFMAKWNSQVYHIFTFTSVFVLILSEPVRTVIDEYM